MSGGLWADPLYPSIKKNTFMIWLLVLWLSPSCQQEIAEPLFHLKLAMEQLSASQTFRCILATVLAIGNFLNGCKVRACLLLSLLCTFLRIDETHSASYLCQGPGFRAELPGEAVPGEGHAHPPAPAAPRLCAPDAALPAVVWPLLWHHCCY